MYLCGISIFVLFLGLIQNTNGREVPDLTFVIRNISNKIEPICIADKNVLDSAIGWIYPIEDVKDKLPLIVSKYIPEIQNDYSCDFLKSKHCSNFWQMEDWQYSKFDSHQFRPTLDPRWEDFPTLLTSNLMKEFKNRIDIPHTFELGISIRATKNAEIFLCSGWDPHTYPCYYINIGGIDNKQAYLRKYKSIPEKISRNDTRLDKYMSDEKLLSEYEWRNFYISLNGNGTIALVDMFKNTMLLNYNDTKAIKPISLFIRSKDEKALWKIHNNHYIFTNKTKLTQLGPTFSINGDSLCVSLYVYMCRYCRMSFYIMINGEKEILKTIFNENEHDDLLWKEIKLLRHDILEDKIRLYVETKYLNNMTASDGFWAIDDIRVCSEDEIKVTRLITTSDWKEPDLSHLSCQALSFPSWRPMENNFVSTNIETEYLSTSTTISISWKPKSDEDHNFQQYYIIQYEGKDLCDSGTTTLIKSRSRLKSQGFVIVRSTENDIKDLMPYTVYHISFWNIIDNIKIQRDVSTLPTDIPKNREVPNNVILQTTDTICEILFTTPDCNETYGPLIYQVKVSSKEENFSTAVTDIKTHYIFKDLQPYANYEVEIRTARKVENFKNSTLFLTSVYNFTSNAGVAPAVENLEAYATSKTFIQLRFNLPNILQGNPNSLQIRWCHPLLLGGCGSDIKALTKCNLWDQKYCVTINNLTTGLAYTFLVSLKNEASHAFGKEANVTGVIVDRVPGTPSNLTYRIRNCVKTVDCCNLNLNWLHPFNQSGIITMFDIILTESSYNFVLDSFKGIHEVLPVTEENYQSVYNYTVKYIACSVPYKISVRAINDHYKGEFATTNITIKNTDYVDPMPKYINSTNITVSYKVPQLDTGSDDSSLIVIVQDYNKNEIKINPEILNLEMFDDINELCNQYGETWIAKTLQLNRETQPLIVIGDGSSSYVTQLNKTAINKPLTPDTEYCFTFTIIKRVKESEHLIVYHDKNLFTEPNYFASQFQDNQTPETISVATYLVPVLVILLFVASGAWFSYRYFQKERYGSGTEHIYESMPFDDYLTDAVSNDTYDRLSHN